MRNEKQAKVNLHLAAGGQVIQVDKAKKQNLVRGDTCIDDYPLGQIGTNYCADTKHHKLIETREMCEEAAREANVHVVQDNFVLSQAWYEVHPIGCFKMTCSLATHHTNATELDAGGGTGECYFFNPVGYDNFVPSDSTGVPVCVRFKLLDGAINPDYSTVNVSDGGCPEGYQVIDTLDACTSAATCRGKALSDPITYAVHNATKFDERPEGCFIWPDNKTVGFNLRPAGRTAAPSNPMGTPICNVTTVTNAFSTGVVATVTTGGGGACNGFTAGTTDKTAENCASPCTFSAAVAADATATPPVDAADATCA
jgi:hypothetical protein